MGDRPGLSGPGTGQHANRAADRLGDGTLLGVETGENLVRRRDVAEGAGSGRDDVGGVRIDAERGRTGNGSTRLAGIGGRAHHGPSCQGPTT